MTLNICVALTQEQKNSDYCHASNTFNNYNYIYYVPAVCQAVLSVNSTRPNNFTGSVFFNHRAIDGLQLDQYLCCVYMALSGHIQVF